jgi:hypothetical protein
MLGGKDGHLALGIALGFMGALATFLWVNGFAHLGYCAEGEDYGACSREWIGALSGWAAALGAVITIFVLWRTLQHMKQSTEQQLRAYLYCISAEVSGLNGSSPKARFVFKNHGATPAYRVAVRRQIFCRPTETDEPVNVQWFEENLGDFGPGQERTSVYDLDPNTAAKLRRESKDNRPPWFYAILAIEYDTAFLQHQKTALRFHNSRGRWLTDGPLTVSDKGVWSD